MQFRAAGWPCWSFRLLGTVLAIGLLILGIALWMAAQTPTTTTATGGLWTASLEFR